jgi:hypothetical protein
MHPTWIGPLLCTNRALRETKPPKSGYREAKKKRPEIPPTPYETRNRRYQ